jgi:transglutaminase-like putative cysteine protease
MMLVQLLRRSLRRWQPRIGWASSLLVVLSVWIVAMGIIEADWVDGDVMLVYVALLSVVVTAILVLTRMAGGWAALIVVLVGLLLVGQGVSRVLPPFVGAIQELWAGLEWWVGSVFGADLPAPTWTLWQESGMRLVILGDRLASWATALVSGQSVRNPVAFLFVSGMIVWLFSAWAVWWAVRRGRPLIAMVPLGFLLSMSTYLGSGEMGWVIGLVGCMTLLLPLAHIQLQEHRWEQKGIDYSPEIRFEIWQIAFLVTIVVVLLALLTPNFSIPRLVWRFWELMNRPQEVIKDLLVRFFGGVEPKEPPALPAPSAEDGGGGRPSASLPRSHLLGGEPGLTRQRVMYVCIDAPAPMMADYPFEELVVGPHYYWRGTTYDTFYGWYWENKPLYREPLAPYAPVLSTTVAAREPLRQRYLIEVPHGNTLYAVGEPEVVDQAATARLRAPDDLVGLEGTMSDYVVRSLVPEATVSQLRAAPEAYSEFVRERYLSLPRRTPARVRNLATEITAEATTAYDKALAVERYLRQFPYDLEIESAPAGEDIVEYFLFDIQRGYCDYYASAFVVLARASGVPTRLAVGYAMGTYDVDRGCYAVTEKDGHSWPEVYFQGYGWIPFEPTAPFRLFERPQDQTLPEPTSPSVPAVPERPRAIAVRAWWRQISGRWTMFIVLGGMVAALLWSISQVYGAWRHSRLTPAEAIALCYKDLSEAGEHLGVRRRPWQTPAEYSSALRQALHNRVTRWPWRGRNLSEVVRETARGVLAVSHAYERASYASHSLQRAHQVQAERQWLLVRRRIRWLRVTSVADVGSD